LAAQTQEASRRLGAVVKETSVSELATEAARHLPFAVLISEATYDFDPEEFDALARDVRACLIPIPSTGMSTEALEDRILKAALESEERRSRGSSMPPAR
jgi:hypothetical protein